VSDQPDSPEQLDPMERTCLYLHGVDGETVAEIAGRQGVSQETVRRSLRSAREKFDAGTNAQAVLRAYINGELADANRARLRRAANDAETREVEKEQRRQRSAHRWRGIGRAWQAPLTEDDDDD
jgi:DNA-binding CsgD family transcriptional regulator